MKKIFAIIAAVGLIGFGNVAVADPGNGNHYGTDFNTGNHYGWGPNDGEGSGNDIGEFTGGIGGYKIKAGAIGGAVDCDVKYIPNGKAGGISGAGGMAGAKAEGKIWNGSVGGDVTATGGGLTVTDAYRWNPCIGDKSIGVGSRSESYAITGATADIYVDPQGKLKWGFIPTAGGETHAIIGGIAAQGTLNGSKLSESPKYFSSTGTTGGIAGQASIGGFKGSAYAISGPDMLVGCRRHRHLIDSKASAGVGALIIMSGSSYSDSYRFVDWNDGMKTEGMGTYVGARTDVIATGYAYDCDRGLGYANSRLCGGYIAIGGAATKTTQIAGNGSGKASACAVGIYAGAGTLNSSYSGSANGYSHTTITTVKGMKGSINTAASGMQVTSVGSSSHQGHGGPQ